MENIPKIDQPQKMKLSGHDQAVMGTSNDALCTKVYAAGLNYFRDDYAALFLKNKRKMYPIINRGTWVTITITINGNLCRRQGIGRHPKRVLIIMQQKGLSVLAKG